MFNFLKLFKKTNVYKILFKKADISLVYNEESKELYLNSTEKVTLRLGGNFHLMVDGNFDTSINGEYNLITNNNKILIDSHNSTIHLNSRLAKQIKDLPESIEWRNKNNTQKSHDKNCDCKDMDDFFKDILKLFNRVEKIENKIKE